MILGIAYHSPLDVIALMPIKIKTTLDSNEVADVYVTEHIITNYNSRLQLVFSSARVLFKANVPIIDQGPWGKIINLTSHELYKILGRQDEPNEPTTKPNKSRTGSTTRLPRWVRL